MMKMKGMHALTSKLPFRLKKKTEVIELCIEALAKVVAKADSNASLSEVREDYERVVLQLLPLAEAEKDVRLQARIRNVQSTLRSAGGVSDKKEQLRLEIARIVSHLSHLAESMDRPKPLAIEPVVETKSQALHAASASEHAMVEDEQVSGANPISARLQELQDRANFLAHESEKIKLENQALFEQNRVLQGQYVEVVQVYDEAKELFRVLQNKVATAQIECNRLLLEIQFLSSERAGVLQNLDGDYESLVSMAKRYKDLQRGYALAKDEAGVYEDLLGQLDTLLGRTRKDKKVLLDKTAESEKSLETLTEELRTVIKKGKIQFYSQLEGGAAK
ncbi:hypothetical protein WDW86_20395 [Bdellovibrionota bacterium FG-2]